MIGVINYSLRLQRISDVVLIIVTGTLLIASVVGPSIFEWMRKVRHDRRVHRDLTNPAKSSISPAS
jgi:rhamnose transport system permease protein